MPRETNPFEQLLMCIVRNAYRVEAVFVLMELRRASSLLGSGIKAHWENTDANGMVCLGIG
ncbi:MAG: hypothetical protein HYZ71_16010 [Deltaproteobacteria bacterium]|nr:hypothetical protein [Deltaproteobacteria bacterium]